MMIFLITVLAIYLLVVVYFYVCQRSMVFYPQPGAFVYEKHAFEFEIDNISLRGWVLNEGQDAVLFYFGGNNENIQMNIDRFKEWFPKHTVYLINYRGYGKSDGSPSETALFQDALTVYDRLGNDFSRISIIGRSLGSGVACHVAANRKVDRLALITPYDSISQVGQQKHWYIPVKWLIKDKFESWKKVDRISSECLVVTAIGDDVVPNNRTANLLNYFSNVKPRLVEIDDTSHGLVMNHPRFGAALRDFFEIS